MALALIAQIDFVDAKNKTSFTRVRIPNGFTIAQYTTFTQELAQAVTNISGCRVTGASIGVNFTFTGLGAAAAAVDAVPSLATMKLAPHFGQRIFMPLSGIRRGSSSYGALQDTHSTLIMVCRCAARRGESDNARAAVTLSAQSAGVRITRILIRPERAVTLEFVTRYR